MATTNKDARPRLRDTLFDAARIRHVADETVAVFPEFDGPRFVAAVEAGFEDLTLMERSRRVTEQLRAGLPSDFRTAAEILGRLAPRLNNGFVALSLSDYVALYGADDFDAAMAALKRFTVFGSSEFAIRPFLRDDLPRTLAVMEEWSRDADPRVRRLASEGCRPRLPWSFRLEALIADPSPVRPILENLNDDPDPDVRRSVANHLNDVAKDNPDWALDLIESWPLTRPRTAGIAKHALRGLIKRGNARALAIVGASAAPEFRVDDFRIAPRAIPIGGEVAFSFRLTSTATSPQRLVVDYVVHYMKKSGKTSGKVFKLRVWNPAPGEEVVARRVHAFADLSTRVHHAGTHRIEVKVNGVVVAGDDFTVTASIPEPGSSSTDRSR